MNALIKRKLNNICEEIRKKIEYPNYGGCGIIAERFYCFLKNHGIDCKIVVFTSDLSLIESEIKNGVPINGNDHYSRSHILIKVEDKYIDSEGIELKHKKMSCNYPEIEVPFIYLVWWNLDHYIWNDLFSRSQIPLIDEIFYSYR